MDKNLGGRIKKLRNKGKSYNDIVRILGCAKSTVAYHCGVGQKAKYKSRAFLRRDKKNTKSRSKRAVLQILSWRYKRFCGCKVCKEKDPVVLEYHHRDHSEKITTISQMMSDRYSINDFKNEIRKCDILCANCHRRQTASEMNFFMGL